MKADELKKQGLKTEISKKPKIEGDEAQETKEKRPPIQRTLLGEMIGKVKQKVYDKESPYYQSVFYKLKTRNIENMENNAPEILYAFKETIIDPEQAPNEKEIKRKEEIWRLIERDEYLGRRYIIYCYYHPKRGYKIYDLQERPLPNYEPRK